MIQSPSQQIQSRYKGCGSARVRRLTLDHRFDDALSFDVGGLYQIEILQKKVDVSKSCLERSL